MSKDKLKTIIQQYNALGGIAIHYPRKRKVALNGFPYISEKEAEGKMLEAIKRAK